MEYTYEITYGKRGTGAWIDPKCLMCDAAQCSGHSVTGQVRQTDGTLREMTDLAAYQMRLIKPISIAAQNFLQKCAGITTGNYLVGGVGLHAYSLDPEQGKCWCGNEENSVCHLGSPALLNSVKGQQFTKEDFEVGRHQCVEHGGSGSKATCLECVSGMVDSDGKSYDAVEPPHYQRGPKVIVEHQCSGAQVGQQEYSIQCIDVMRAIQDPRLATALKYVWRVAFGGKKEPWDSRTQEEIDIRDIFSAIWYLRDYLSFRSNPSADGLRAEYNALVRDTNGAE